MVRMGKEKGKETRDHASGHASDHALDHASDHVSGHTSDHVSHHLSKHLSFVEYIRYSSCYRMVLANQSLDRACNPTWNILEPKLKSVTAYEFYCNANSNTVWDIRSYVIVVIS